MSNFKITAKAPTSWQRSALGQFNMGIENLNGSFYSEKIFDSEKDAKGYLVGVATVYYDEFEGQVDDHLENIENYGMLTIDGVTARICEEE